MQNHNVDYVENVYICGDFSQNSINLNFYVMKEIYLQDLIKRFEKWFYQPNRFGFFKNDDGVTLNVTNYSGDVWFNVHIPFDCLNYFSHNTIQKFESKRKFFVLKTWLVNIPKRFIELNFYVYNCKVLFSSSASVQYDNVSDLPF